MRDAGSTDCLEYHAAISFEGNQQRLVVCLTDDHDVKGRPELLAFRVLRQDLRCTFADAGHQHIAVRCADPAHDDRKLQAVIDDVLVEGVCELVELLISIHLELRCFRHAPDLD